MLPQGCLGPAPHHAGHLNELLRELKDQPLSGLAYTGAQLGELVALIDDGTLSGKMAKEVFMQMLAQGQGPGAIVAERGLSQVSDGATLEPLVAAVLAANPDSVAKYQAGKTQVLGLLVGQVMQQSGGKANPKLVNGLLRQLLAR